MDLKDAAERVILGVNEYRARHGELPISIEILVPEFISAGLPIREMHYDPKDGGSISFVYTPTWPQSGKGICSTKVKVVSWKCIGFI